ncbi:MAG TPA: hypothetical protein VGB74_18060 [Actinoplanes sp.]
MSRTGHSRRWVLGAAGAGLGAAALTGCGLFDDPEPPAAPDPLQAVLDEAVALAAAYDRLFISKPDLRARLGPLADDHRAHAAELARLLDTTVPSAAASPATGTGATAAGLADLRKTERLAQKTASTYCLRAPVARAALTGSIAACRATHVEALR